MANLPFFMSESKSNIIKREDNSLIEHFFSKELIKKLYYHAMRVDIEDNNEKAEMILGLLDDSFHELGTGTNRIAVLKNGFVCKIALDYRGLVDNFTEYKRSSELPHIFTKVYECNMLIVICEYVTVMDRTIYIENKEGIIELLNELSDVYIFNDVGYNLKNYYNMGYRDNGEIVILDYGYMYPIKGNEQVLSCPQCKSKLKYNSTFTKFECSNCTLVYSIMEITRRMRTDLEDSENKTILRLNNCKMPDFKAGI